MNFLLGRKVDNVSLLAKRNHFDHMYKYNTCYVISCRGSREKTRRKHGILGEVHMEGVRKMYSTFVESQKLRISPAQPTRSRDLLTFLFLVSIGHPRSGRGAHHLAHMVQMKPTQHFDSAIAYFFSKL